MDITTQFAARGYSTLPKPAPSKVEDLAGKAGQDFANTLASSEATSLAAMRGEADSQALVEALAQTELAVQTAVAVRDKVVEAYQEILRMPV